MGSPRKTDIAAVDHPHEPAEHRRAIADDDGASSAACAAAIATADRPSDAVRGGHRLADAR